MLSSAWQLMIDLALVEIIVVIDDYRIVEVLENVHNAAAIPVVCDTATVIDVAGGVLKHLERRLGVLH